MSPYGLSEQMTAMMEANSEHMSQGSVFSLTLATVKDTNDKKKLNRVRCLPIGAPDNEMSEWCYVMAPMGGSECGLFLFPKVGDLVVMGYLGNDVHRPIVLGSFWNTTMKPPAEVKKGKCDDYIFKTPKNVEVTVHDEEKKQKIYVKLPSGAMVVVDEEKETILTKNKGEDTALIFKMKDGEVELKAKNKLTLKCGKGSLTLEKNGNITAKTTNKILLDGKSTDLQAKGKLTLKATNVAAEANNGLDLKANGIASVKGSMLKLN